MQHSQSNKENRTQTQSLPQKLKIYVHIFPVFFRNAQNEPEVWLRNGTCYIWRAQTTEK